MITNLVPLGIAVAAAVFALGVTLESRARRRQLAPVLAQLPATPPSVYPRINKDACICSGACVTACPEGNVIDIVDGRPRLIRPSACVGHSDCLRSCPVSAIELVLGSEERAVEVPIANSAFETTVAGLYVAGEITGMGLIHNAVAQGVQVARAALANLDAHACDLDLLIIGGGPAGLGAALEAQRLGVRHAVFEKAAFGGAIRTYPRQKIVMTSPLDLPGIGKIKLRRTSKEALIELFEELVQRTHLPIVENAEVTAIERIAGGLRVETKAGVATARRVILAIGRRGSPRRLGVPGGDQAHVVYEITDPARHTGQSVAVVGGGDSAVELALALAAQRGTRVTLVHRGKDFGRCKPANQDALAAARAAGRIDVQLETTVRAVTPRTVELVNAQGARSIDAAVVACCLGAELPSTWLKQIGVALRELRGEPLQRKGMSWLTN